MPGHGSLSSANVVSCNIHRPRIFRAVATLYIAAVALCGFFASSSPRYRVSLVTVDPGSEYYSLEGHTGLRFTDGENDVVVNWGVFDFNSPNFLYRFVCGETDYMCVAEPTSRFLAGYAIRYPGRGVSEQVLPLDSVHTEILVEKIIENLRPENSRYRYNYVKDNCATRPLNLIEQSLGQIITIPALPPQFSDGASFREVMTYYHRNYPWYQFGIDIALGSGIDTLLNPRDYLFAPVILREMIDPGIVNPESGEFILLPSSAEGVVLPPTPILLTPMAVMWVIAVIVIALITTMVLKGRFQSTLVRTIYTTWFSILFLTGSLVAFLVFVSSHEATSPNYNLLWLNPLAIIGTFSVWFKKLKMVWECYHFVNFACVLAYAIVWLAGIQQGNPAFAPLLLTDAFLSAIFITYTLRHRKAYNS